jgi:nitrate reductase cytochrome c-type subunit
MINLISVLFSILISYSNANLVHDFSKESWANGKTCLICHDLKNNLPKLTPPGARTISISNLTANEQAAFDKNVNNITCAVCHQTLHSPIVTNSGPASGNMNLPSGPNTGISSGSEGSTGMRVINQARNLSDCLQCHDIHNKDSLKLLKSDYYQN